MAIVTAPVKRLQQGATPSAQQLENAGQADRYPSAMDSPERPPDPVPSPAVGTRRRPRAQADTAAVPQVRFALGLLLLFLFLLVLWIAWPILTRGG